MVETVTLDNIVGSDKISTYVSVLSPPAINKTCPGEEWKNMANTSVFSQNHPTLQKFVQQAFPET